MLPRIEYLEWISSRVDEVTHNLGSSDLGSPYQPIVPSELDDLPDPPADRSLESLVAEQYGHGITPENVLVTAGTTQANVITAGVVIDAAESAVLVETPGYEPLVASPDGLGAKIRRFPRREAEDYRIDPERVANGLDESVDLVTVTNRHNPSGRMTSRETLEETAAVVADAGARLLVDEVYAPFVTEPEDGEKTAFGSVTAAGVEGTVVTQSLDKFHGYGELRIGWIISDSLFVDRARSVRFHIPSVADPSRAIASRILANTDTIGERSRERLTTNHEQLRSFVRERDDLDGFVSPGSTVAFLKHQYADGDELVDAALADGILVIPGRFFGDPRGFRISAGRSPDAVSAGLEAFGAVLDAL